MKIKIEFGTKEESKPLKEVIIGFFKRLKNIKIKLDDKKNIILDI